ncbi:MAG TPA: hypothetical protein VFV34_05820, partial [Blastocatellia bacterium]|nr:hypothetical protein [Blastocatellia bacterium]
MTTTKKSPRLPAVVLTMTALATVIAPGREMRSTSRSQGDARLVLIVVMDGLRPDSINAEDTPTLFRL